MVPHAGTDSRVWREVTALGEGLGLLEGIRGTRTVADAAMLWDWQSWWAQALEWRPSEEHDARERADTFYASLYDRHLTVDFAHPDADLSAYPLVVVPALYLATEETGRNLRRYVENGGTLVVSYFSGIVDTHDAVHPGPYPGALRDVLGLTIEEFSPLGEGETVRLITPEGAPEGPELTGDLWTDVVMPRGAETVWSYADGIPAGRPAVTRNRLGKGTAWYVSTRLSGPHLDAVLDRACADAAIAPRTGLSRDVEVVRRSGDNGTYLFAINHTDTDTEVALDAPAPNSSPASPPRTLSPSRRARCASYGSTAEAHREPPHTHPPLPRTTVEGTSTMYGTTHTRRAAGTVAALSGLLFAALPAQAAHAATTPANPGFESGSTGWSTYSAGGQSAASFTEAGGHAGSTRLSHWSASAYKVETYQYLSGLTDGTYTLSAWVRSGGGQNSAHIALRNCGGAEQRTDLPPTADGAWIRLVTSVKVTGGACTISLNSDAHAGSGPTSTTSRSPRAPPG